MIDTTEPQVWVLIGVFSAAMFGMIGIVMTSFHRTLVAMIGGVESKLGSIDTKIGAVETRIGALETRIGRVETKLDGLDRDVQALTRHVFGNDAH